MSPSKVKWFSFSSTLCTVGSSELTREIREEVCDELRSDMRRGGEDIGFSAGYADDEVVKLYSPRDGGVSKTKPSSSASVTLATGVAGAKDIKRRLEGWKGGNEGGVI